MLKQRIEGLHRRVAIMGFYKKEEGEIQGLDVRGGYKDLGLSLPAFL